MLFFLCKLWPYLAGGLIGWLLAGWFARRLKYVNPPIEKLIEKYTDKIVDNPKHLEKIADLEMQMTNLKRGPVIDIKAAKSAGLAIKTDTDFTVIEGIGPQINDLIHAGGISTFSELADSDPLRIQKILDEAGPRFNIANPGTWPDQANLVTSNRWSALKTLQDVLDGGVYPDKNGRKTSASPDDVTTAVSKKKAVEKAPQKLDIAAAKVAGFKVKQNNGQDSFTLIEGIGPKINDLIHADGVHTFSDLAKTDVEDIQKILDNAGASFKLAKPGTWPAQAEMAASNQWDSLKAWQDELDGGE